MSCEDNVFSLYLTRVAKWENSILVCYSFHDLDQPRIILMIIKCQYGKEIHNKTQGISNMKTWTSKLLFLMHSRLNVTKLLPSDGYLVAKLVIALQLLVNWCPHPKNHSCSCRHLCCRERQIWMESELRPRGKMLWGKLVFPVLTLCLFLWKNRKLCSLGLNWTCVAQALTSLNLFKETVSHCRASNN